MNKALDSVQKYLVYSLVFLVPLAVLPIFPNAFVTIKLALLAIGVGLALFLWAIKTLVQGKFEISIASLDLPVLLLAAVYITSAIIKTPNKMEAFFLPGTATIIAASALLYFVINNLKQKEKSIIPTLLIVAGLIISFVSLFAAAGFFAKIPQLPAFIKNERFTLLGGNLSTAIFLGTILPFALVGLTSKKIEQKIISISAGLIIVLGLALNIYHLSQSKLTLLDYRTSWFVAVDTLKESPVWGIGPANYLTAFNRFRPLFFNQTDNWAFRFGSSRNFYLNLLTETGFAGAFALILLILVSYRVYSKQTKELKQKALVGWGLAEAAPLVSLTILAALLFFFSPNLVHLELLFILLALISKTKKATLSLSTQQSETPVASRLPAIIVSLPIIIGLSYLGVRGGRVLAAEASFKKALNSLVANNAQDTFNALGKAIRLNPNVDRYHSSLSQVSFMLANSISQKEEITDDDRTAITQLIAQSINEGKATVATNPTRAGNWQLLARTYQAIIPFAQGADTFAIQTFNQAVALDPLNPDLRISLGGVYFGQKDYENAIDTFKLAVAAKPDHANAHYNLAVAYRENGDLDKAANEMSLVLSLVERGSDDWELAKKELEALQSRAAASAEASAGQGEKLNPPQPAPEPAIEPPVELPEEASPPAALEE
jgi:tetratricopeptide (TPR) repeat protein